MLSILPFLIMQVSGFVDRPFIDFDVVIKELAPSGQWVQSEEASTQFQPSGGMQPYRHGRWYYTDYGWTWKSAEPSGWMTDHYGYWKQEGGKWAWFPGEDWLPATVEWLQSGEYYGWRPSHLDRFSNMLETEAERYEEASQWSFVPKSKLGQDLKPEDFVSVSQAEELLRNAQPVDHVFVSYREIPRPGPAPEILTGQKGKTPPIPVVRDLKAGDAEAPGGNSLTAEYYVYRPKFHQDMEGIARRVTVFLHPETTKAGKTKEALETKPTEQQLDDLRKYEENRKRQAEHMEELYR